MKKLLNFLFIIILLISCNQKKKLSLPSLKQDTVNEFKTVNKQQQTIDSFLKKLQSAIKDNDINYIKNSISFPFEYKSGGELVNIYNNYEELMANKKFNLILKAHYIKGCNEKNGNIEYYCLSYFDEAVDITFYAKKENNLFKLIKMETPN